MKIETIADIVAEKRNRADEIERDVAEKMKRGEMISDQYAREVVADLRKEANRLEAAVKREPARNCDVGTVEDQLVRFDRFCGAKVHCRECVLRNSCSCKFAWAQLPYVDRKKRGVTK